jgi:hypothetical protein
MDKYSSFPLNNNTMTITDVVSFGWTERTIKISFAHFSYKDVPIFVIATHRYYQQLKHSGGLLLKN